MYGVHRFTLIANDYMPCYRIGLGLVHAREVEHQNEKQNERLYYELNMLQSKLPRPGTRRQLGMLI